MSRFDLPDNFIDNPEALIRRTRAKLKKVQTEASSSTSQLEAPPSELGVQPSVFQSLTLEFDAMANKSLREFSAPTMDNIRTGPAVDNKKSFELKLALINMVQASQFCGKSHEDASAHL
jgi:hypothetical protein